MPDNWKRNQIIAEAARRIISQAPDISQMSHTSRNRTLLELRRKLSGETGCSLDTAGRHIGLRSLLRQ